MGRNLVLLLFFLSLSSADWNILQNQRWSTKSGLQITLKNYCEAWRINVELHNIRAFDVVPDECVEFIWKYVTSTQYTVNSERTIDEIKLYLSTSVDLNKDGRDAWIFDIDDTLLSTFPFYKKNGFGGQKVDPASLEEWKRKAKAPALDHSLRLFHHLKGLGIQTFLVSSRSECLKAATIDNLVDAGYHGWTNIILRGPEFDSYPVKEYKSEVRKQLINSGYHVWGILGDHWSSIDGPPFVKRTFKLPNPLYYVA